MKQSELTERDLLIKLQSQLEDFKAYTKEKFENLESNLDGLSNLKTDVAVLKERTHENTRFRLWVYGAVTSSVISSVLAVYNMVK